LRNSIIFIFSNKRPLMENIVFKKSLNKQGQITELEIGGMLVLENSLQLKNEFIGAAACLSKRVKIVISNVEEIDLSCIQLFIAFIKLMNEAHVTSQFIWNLDHEQSMLLENAGLTNELFMNN